MAYAIKEPEAPPRSVFYTCRHCGYQWKARRMGPRREIRYPLVCPYCRKYRPTESQEVNTNG